jgi:hypothetical protein
VYQNYPSIPDSLSGQSITQILAAANQALAGNGLPAGYSFDMLAALIEQLNLSFNGCAESFFGSKFLFNPVE